MPQQQTSVITRPSYDRIIASITDSSGIDVGGGVSSYLGWHSVLVNRLNDPYLGLCNVRERRNAFSGRTTQNTSQNGQVSYKTCLRPYVVETPVLGIISMGVNDPGAGVSTSQTTTNLEAMILGMLFGAAGNGSSSAVVADHTALPAGSAGWGSDSTWNPDRIVVLADSASSGGATPLWTPSNALATVPSAGSGGLGVWECVFPGVTGVAGWRRVANLSTFATLVAANSTLRIPGGIPYIIINGAWYLNFTDGSGDVTKTCTGITRSGTTATATVTAHGWSNGNTVNIPNASDSNLCGSFVISGVTANTFNYTVTNTGATSVGACNATKMYSTYDDVAGVRKAQKDAQAAIGVADRVKYVDQWAAEQSQITSGNTTQGSEIFNLLTLNQHRNAAGCDLMAATLYNTVSNWSSLMSALQFPV